MADGFKLNFLVLTSALNASVEHAVLFCGHTRPDNCLMAKAGYRVTDQLKIEGMVKHGFDARGSE